jgi:hypothetical protein
MTHAASRRAIDYPPVVKVVDVCNVYVVHRAVIVECSIAPVSAYIAGTKIAKAVVNTSIKTDTEAPITGGPEICVASPSPVTRCP